MSQEILEEFNLPPLIDRPEGFIAPSSFTGQNSTTSKHIPCACRCGYLVLPDRTNHKCINPNHQGKSNLLFAAFCFKSEEEGSFNGTCNFCLLI